MELWYYVAVVALAVLAFWPRKVIEEKSWTHERFDDPRHDRF